MTWRAGKTHWYIQHTDGSTISKSGTVGETKYLLWMAREKDPKGPFKSADSAKVEHAKLTHK